MALTRSTIARGPAIITWNGLQIFSTDDIQANVDKEVLDIVTTQYGNVKSLVVDRKAEIIFTPVVPLADIPTLFPTNLLEGIVGRSIFGDTDIPLHIYSLSQNKHLTFHASAITKLPDLILSAGKYPVGSMTWTCINAQDKNWEVAGAFLTVNADAAPALTFDPDDLGTAGKIAATWSPEGETPWTGLHTEDGWTVTFNMTTKPQPVDDFGTYDHTLQNISATVKARLLNKDVDALVALMGITGANAARGKAAPAGNLVLTGDNLSATIYAVKAGNLPLRYGSATPRYEAVEWSTDRLITTGALQPLAAIS